MIAVSEMKIVIMTNCSLPHLFCLTQGAFPDLPTPVDESARRAISAALSISKTFRRLQLWWSPMPVLKDFIFAGYKLLGFFLLGNWLHSRLPLLSGRQCRHRHCEWIACFQTVGAGSCVLVYMCVHVWWLTCVLMCAGLHVCWLTCVLMCAGLHVSSCVLAYVRCIPKHCLDIKAETRQFQVFWQLSDGKAGRGRELVSPNLMQWSRTGVGNLNHVGF